MAWVGIKQAANLSCLEPIGPVGIRETLVEQRRIPLESASTKLRMLTFFAGFSC